METSIYIRLRHRIHLHMNTNVKLKDIAQVIAPESLLPALLYVEIYQIRPEDKQIIIIEAMAIVEKLLQQWPEADIQLIGPAQTIIDTAPPAKKSSFPLFIFVWWLLFIGAALTIMNFHEDVSMQAVHIKLYELVTGEQTEQPLVFQIPYSIGLGAGMILFFNHLFKKRFNEEPSPLEIEMFKYQQEINQYVILNEQKESRIYRGYRS
ncbi:stage V sporulation protein AA [Bacillus xiapuensis]|uniref:stage V sporulation protein AA n=1 Tax=Bacillus xiapuensis TaxID=2014075 RepID=UPI000C232E23|nr:stage V sporulation protein AA [Bacillus xiapuensis]